MYSIDTIEEAETAIKKLPGQFFINRRGSLYRLMIGHQIPVPLGEFLPKRRFYTFVSGFVRAYNLVVAAYTPFEID